MSDIENKEKIVLRIKKLFALARGKANKEESDLAMLKAQEMLIRYGLSSEEISELKGNKQKVGENFLEKDTKGFPSWKIRIALVICPNFRVTPLVHHGYSGHRSIMLIGLIRDIDVCKEVVEFAFFCFNKFFKEFLEEWKKKLPKGSILKDRAVSLRVRNDYLYGFIEGLDTKFKNQVSEKALIIVQDNAVKEKVGILSGGKTALSGVLGLGSEEARDKGYKDGLSFDKHKMIGGEDE